MKTVEAFAAERRERLTVGDDALRPAVVEALRALYAGEEDWSADLVRLASRIWLENYVAESPSSGGAAARRRFESRLLDTLAKTSEVSNRDAQVDRIVSWLSTYTVNAGTMAGSAAAGRSHKMWVAMDDSETRETHAAADGQVRPAGSTFSVGGAKLAYPGDPSGPLQEIMGCRCVMMPAARTGEAMSANTFNLGAGEADDELDNPSVIPGEKALVAAGNEADSDEPRTGALVVLLPAADDPVSAATSEDQAHMTFVWMGDVGEIDDAARAAIAGEVRSYATAVDGPVVVPVMRRGELGDDGADVVFLERTDAVLALRDGLMESSPNLLAAHDAAEQFPEWIPHVTVNYGDKQAGHDPNGAEQEGSGAGGAAGRMSHLESDAIESPTDDHSQGFAVVGVQDRSGGQQREDDPRERGRASLMRDGEVRATGASGAHGRLGALGAARQAGLSGDVLDPSSAVLAARGEGLGSLPPVPGRDVQDVPAETPREGRRVQEFASGSRVHAESAGEVRSEAGSEGKEGRSGSTPPIGSQEWNDLVNSITEITFDRFGLWLGGEYTEYPMGGAMTAAATIAPTDAEVTDEDLPVEPIDEDDDAPEAYEAIPVSGVAAMEGKPTGDGRSFTWEGLTAAPTPQPLGFEFESSHGGDNSRVAIVGRIDRFERHELGDGTAEMRWWGVIFPHKAYAGQALDGIYDGSYTGLSVIVDEVELDVEATEASFDPTGAKQQVTHFKKARIRRFDMVPTGAYYEGYIQFGHAFAEDLTDEDRTALAACGCAELPTDASGDLELDEQAHLAAGAFAPDAKDSPGWITHPRATSRIRHYWVKGEGAKLIGWGTPGDLNRCRAHLAKYVQNPEWLAGLCANLHHEALGIWPAQHHGARALVASAATAERAQPFTIVAAATVRQEFPDEWFDDPKFTSKTNLTIDRETGRVYGHLAYWDSCHIGIAGTCTTPPRNASGYAAFLKGVVDTTAGERRVGVLTYGIGHADPSLRAAAATAHYDRPDAVRAYVNIGEDRFGIWYAGVTRPGVTDEQIDEFRAIGAISGDWRMVARRYELVAAVGVNTPGYSVSLVASGEVQEGLILEFEQSPILASAAETAENQEYLADIVTRAVAKIRHQERESASRARAHQMRQVDTRARARKGD